jgi:hypothetical protein
LVAPEIEKKDINRRHYNGNRDGFLPGKLALNKNKESHANP